MQLTSCSHGSYWRKHRLSLTCLKLVHGLHIHDLLQLFKEVLGAAQEVREGLLLCAQLAEHPYQLKRCIHVRHCACNLCTIKYLANGGALSHSHTTHQMLIIAAALLIASLAFSSDSAIFSSKS
jgi:hypothetical protein